MPDIRRTLVTLMGVAALSWAYIPGRSSSKTAVAAEPASAKVDAAIAVLHPTEGHAVKGTVRLTRQGAGIHVVAHVEGLTPGGHGFHVHEFGDCSAADGASAGGHFDPDTMPHAGREAAQRHVGDLGNVIANDKGIADADFVDTVLALEGKHSVVGRAIIVHAGEDDLKAQPSGAAGARVACGDIGIAAP